MDDETRSPTPREGADDDPHPPSQPPQTPCAFDLLDPDRLLTPQELASLRTHLAALAARLNTPGSVRVRFVDDERMTLEHQRASNLRTTTDVLTFDLSGDPHTLDADLFVCVDEAQRAASSRHNQRALELLLYTLHGTLHCLGHDDLDPESFKRMHAREDELLTQIGLGPVFAATPSDTEPSP